MNRTILGTLLLGSLVLTGSTSGQWTVPQSSHTGSEQPVIKTAKITHSYAITELTTIRLETFNGLTLHDNRQTVINKRGVPHDIKTDPLFKDLEIYEYGYMSVGLDGGIVEYVSIPAEAEIMVLDGITVPIEPAQIRRALGNPDFIAEDGLVYQRGNSLLKVYINEDHGSITHVNYYYMTSS